VSFSRRAMADVEMMAESASMTSEEMNLLYSPSRWCKRMSAEHVVEHHCDTAHNGHSDSYS